MRLIKINQIKENPTGVHVIKYNVDNVSRIGILPISKIKRPALDRLFNRFGTTSKPVIFYGFWINQKTNQIYAVSEHTSSIINHPSISFTDTEKQEINNGNYISAYNKGFVKINMSWGNHAAKHVVDDKGPCMWVMNANKQISTETLNTINSLADKLCRRVYKVNDSDDNTNVKLGINENWLFTHEGLKPPEMKQVAHELLYEPVSFIKKYKSGLNTKYIDQPEP